MRGPEYERQRRLADALRLFGWRHVWFRPARTAQGWRTPLSGDRGFPDIVAVRDGTLLFVEVKADGRRPAAEQAEWLGLLSAVEATEVWLVDSRAVEARLLELISGGRLPGGPGVV